MMLAVVGFPDHHCDNSQWLQRWDATLARMTAREYLDKPPSMVFFCYKCEYY
jgi:hypothetical protein